MKTVRRRDFIKKTALAVTVPVIWTGRSALGAAPEGASSKNDQINVGSIGLGVSPSGIGYQVGDGSYKKLPPNPKMRDMRGCDIARQALHFGKIVATCDADISRAERFKKLYANDATPYQDYRKLLDRKDIDAVTIGTPDHWHVKIAIEAMQSGKDVYCEKPLTLTVGEGKLITEAVKKYGRVFQVGTQQRSEFNSMFLKAVAIAKSGRLGDKLHALASVGPGDQGGPFPTTPPPATLDWNLWQGQAPVNPFCIERFDFGWFRWWLAYSGGQVTDWGVHHGDIAAWALGADQTGPKTIEGKGNFPGMPEGVSFLDILAGKAKNLPNSFNVAQNFDVHFTFPNGNTARLFSGPNELIISGDKGKIRVNRGSLTGKPIEEIAASKEDQEWLDQEVIKIYKGKKPGSHMGNFFECIRDRSEPQSDVASHVNAVNMCHMANIAMMTGRKLTWDQAAYEFVGDDEANAFINRPQRKGFEISI